MKYCSWVGIDSENYAYRDQFPIWFGYQEELLNKNVTYVSFKWKSAANWKKKQSLFKQWQKFFLKNHFYLLFKLFWYSILDVFWWEFSTILLFFSFSFKTKVRGYTFLWRQYKYYIWSTVKWSFIEIDLWVMYHSVHGSSIYMVAT